MSFSNTFRPRNLQKGSEFLLGTPKIETTQTFQQDRRNAPYSIRIALTGVLPFFFLSGSFMHVNFLMVSATIIMAALFVLSAPAAHGISKIVGFSLTGLASLILILSKAQVSDWSHGIAANMDLVVLFVTLPFLSVPLRYGNYLASVEGLFRRNVKKNFQVYGFVMIFTFLTGAVFNLAAIHIVNQLLGGKGGKERQELIALASIRGFTACIFWSPNFFSVGLVLSMTGVRWIDLFPYGVLISISVLALGFALDVIHKWIYKVPQVMHEGNAAEEEKYSVDYRKLLELMAFGLLLLVVIVLLETWYEIEILVLVPTAALIYPLIWLGYLHKLSALPEIITDYCQQELPRHANEVVLFTGAGIFGAALTVSYLSNYFVTALEKVVGQDPFVSMMAISLCITALFIIGLNPIITITAMVSSQPLFIVQWDPMLLALGLIVGWGVGIVISPFAALNLMMAGMLDKSPLEIAIRKNYVYALMMFPPIWGLIAIFNKYFF